MRSQHGYVRYFQLILLLCRNAFVGAQTILYSLPSCSSSALARYLLPCRDAYRRRLHDISLPAEMLIVGAHTILNSLPNSLARTHHRTFNLARISLSILKQIFVS
jgi:hypothetical protein